MQIGMIGLGKMGSGMSRRLLAAGHAVVAYDLQEEAVRDLMAAGAETAASLQEMTKTLIAPRYIWMMVPAGAATSRSVHDLASLLEPGDCVVDGGNSHYVDSVRHASELADAGISWLDVGTSGGIWGEKEGYCLSIGGDREAFLRLEKVFGSVAPSRSRGYAYVGPAGAGHFVKMVHNGIEYALLEAYGEGFDLLEAGPYELDLAGIADLWSEGAVIRSWILELAGKALRREGGLDDIAPEVEGGETGRWAVEAALASEVPFDLTTSALFKRYQSRRDSTALRLVAALRQQFGGHAVKKPDS